VLESRDIDREDVLYTVRELHILDFDPKHRARTQEEAREKTVKLLTGKGGLERHEDGRASSWRTVCTANL
jgi:hypothetical protein